MSSIALPALRINPPEQQPNILEQFARIQAIKGQQQQQQMGAVQLQQAQRAQQDQKILGNLMIKHQGNLDKVAEEAPQAGVSPNAVIGLQQHLVDVKTKTAALTADQLKNEATQHDNARGLLQPIVDAPPEKQPELYAQARQQALQNPQAYGITDPTKIPEQYPGAEALKTQIAIHMGGAAQAEQGIKERQTVAQEQTAQGRLMQGQAAMQKTAPLPAPQIGFLNKQLENRYQVLNPGQPLPPEYTVPQGANRQTFEDISTSLEKLENAATARANRLQQQQIQGGARADARSEKSYQFNSNQLEKVAQPVDQAISRMGRLQDALAQNTPQADALIAPELLSVMAGGAGSGLRMNEAEIQRIVGGRSKWESLKASVNQWQLDPSKANSITPDQRQQIRSLVTEVDNKLKAKQSALDEARNGLINSDDPAEHKRIVVNARNKMSAIDQGSQPQAASGMVRFKDSQGGIHDIPAANLNKAKQRDPGLQVINQ